MNGLVDVMVFNFQNKETTLETSETKAYKSCKSLNRNLQETKCCRRKPCTLEKFSFLFPRVFKHTLLPDLEAPLNVKRFKDALGQ